MRYHVVLREVRETVLAVESDKELSDEAVIEKARNEEFTELSDVTGVQHLHNVEGPVPEGFSPRFDYTWISNEHEYLEEEDVSETPYNVSAELIHWCRPIFDECVRGPAQLMDHNQVEKILRDEGVVLKDQTTDCESGCFYSYFKTEDEAKAFVDRLNEWTDKKLAELPEVEATPALKRGPEILAEVEARIKGIAGDRDRDSYIQRSMELVNLREWIRGLTEPAA